MQALYGPSSGRLMRKQDMLLDWLLEDRATDRLANTKGKHPQGQQQHQSPYVLDLRPIMIVLHLPLASRASSFQT